MRTDGTQPWPTSAVAGGSRPPRSSLECARSPTPAAGMDGMQRRAWHEQGLAMLPVDEIADPTVRQAIANEAARRWGRRNGGRVHGR